MGLLLIIPFVAAIAAVVVFIGALMGFFLTCLAAIATSMVGLLALVLLI
ncbi:MAG: hypothetical protein IBX67_01560 [Dehalococcoidia bacterium]|nr:hypothetical protein [Dehalococcoidia bacterium]